MNQTPAAILILAASVSGYAACTPVADPLRMVNGLAAISLGVWGVFSLLRWQWQPHSTTPDRPNQTNGARSGPIDLASPDHRAGGNRSPLVSPRLAPGRPSDHQFSPEINAQLSLVAHVQGRDQTQIMEDVLRRHLPRYSNSGCV